MLSIAGVHTLPMAVSQTLDPLGKAAGAVGLLTIGLIIRQGRPALDRNAATNTVLKLVLMPLAMLAVLSLLATTVVSFIGYIVVLALT